eukprot:scpid10737/ scgid21208/ Complement C3; Complement C3 beta chain; Complement C3 alpha chain; C3a anaphylatoxin; Complement C3 gamma chain
MQLRTSAVFLLFGLALSIRAAHGTPCQVVLPSTFKVQQKQNANVYFEEGEGSSGSIATRPQVTLSVRRSSAAGAVCDSSLPEPCLAFKTKRGSLGRSVHVPIKVFASRVPECLPGEVIPVTVTAVCRLGNSTRSQSWDVSLRCRRARVILQLDKPVYSAGQKVFMRGFFVDDMLRTVKQNVTLEVRNPNGVLVGLKMVTSGQASQGVVEHEFILDTEPQFGFWSVSALPAVADGNAVLFMPTRTTFEVKDYVLPRFQVEVNLPSYIEHLEDPDIAVDIAASYTFNAAVAGSVSITAAIVWKEKRRELILSKIEKDLVPEVKHGRMYGRTSFTIPSSSIWEALGYGVFPLGSCLKVEAAVRDRTSLRQVKGAALTCFIDQPCRIDATMLDSVIKPGLPFSSQVRLVDYEDHPAPDRSVTITFRQIGSGFSASTQVMQAMSDSNGFIHFRLPGVGILPNTYSASMKIMSNCSQPFEQHFRICHASPSCPGNIKLVAETRQRAAVEENHLLQIQVSQAPEQNMNITVQAVRDGSILHTSQHTILSGNAHLEDIHVYIRPEWSPGFYWLVYHICDGASNIIADSVYQPVAHYQQNQARFHFEPHQVEFSHGYQQAPMLKLSAQRGTSMYMLTVDQSVYFMNATNRLTHESIASYGLQDYPNSCLYEDSCNPTIIFKKAGLLTPIVLHRLAVVERNLTNPHCLRESMERIDIEDCCQQGRAVGKHLVGKGYVSLRCLTAATRTHRQDKVCSSVFQSCCVNYHTVKGPIDPDRLRTSSGKRFSLDKLYERNYFPETMIRTIDMDEPTKLVPFHLPDTITTWSMQAVAVHNAFPLAIPKELQFTVHKEFFLEVHLPSTLTHKEQFELRVTLHSRSARPQPFDVYLVGSWKYCSQAGSGGRSGNASIIVPREGTISLTFVITPLVTGDIEIGVQAIGKSPQESDYVTRMIHVKPSGVRITDQCDSFPIVLRQGNSFEQEFNLTLPGNQLPSTSTAMIKVSGNVLSHLSQLDGVDDMLEMPYGCGEQNMMRFSINVFVLRYLSRTCAPESTGQALNRLVKHKALMYMRTGYQRQLNFQRDDGSFSAFGNKDKSGSTWLTAFVAKSFCAVDASMRQDIPIDDTVIEKALLWLKSHRTHAGGFYEAGDVIDECIMGGAGGYRSPEFINYQLTAYVAIAMFECSERFPMVREAAQEAATYLTNRYSKLINTYDLALASYALSLAGQRVIDPGVILSKLDSFSTVIDGSTCDTRHQRTPSQNGRSCTGVFLETSAYAMLARMQLGAIEECGQCYVDWFLRWRKDSGGFVSTQDTVLVTQALTEYHCCHVGEQLQQNLSITLTSRMMNTNKTEARHLSINAFNKDLEQRVLVRPNFNKGLSIRVNASGEGRATVQYCLKYNVMQHEKTCNFTIHTRLTPSEACSQNAPGTLKPESCMIVMDVTVSFIANGELNSTGMVIVEITMLSGFTVDVKDLHRIVEEYGRVRRAERHGQTVLIYLTSLKAGKAMTISLRLFRTALLGLLQPAAIKVYDYYNPGISCHKFYNLPTRNPMLSLLCHDQGCLCGAGECKRCPRAGIYSVASTVKGMAQVVCQNDYAWRIKVLKRIALESGWVRFRIIIEFRIKRGSRDVAAGDKFTFYRPAHCTCPDMERGASYLITGPDRGLKLMLDKDTSIERWTKTRRFCRLRRLIRTKPGVCDAVDAVWYEFKQGKEYNACGALPKP